MLKIDFLATSQYKREKKRKKAGLKLNIPVADSF